MKDEYVKYEGDLAEVPKAEELMGLPSTSYWLKESLRAALQRDPVDAARDAEVLALVLSSRADSLLKAQASGTGLPSGRQ